MTTVTVRHNFEAAHRLPHLPGKCVSLHGHSWWVAITVSAPDVDAEGLVVEFGAFKNAVRGWIDANLDHGTLLGPNDPLVAPLRAAGCKVHLVAGWPTVERVAALLGRVASDLVDVIHHAPGARVSAVDLQETHVNRAGWTPP